MSLFILVLLPSLFLIIGVGVILSWMLQPRLESRGQAKAQSDSQGLQLRELMRKYGYNSSSFFGLYPGFDYFTTPTRKYPGVFPYVETGPVLVGAAEPLVSQEHQVEFLRDFAHEARSYGKSAILLPVGAPIAEAASQAGFHSIYIGSEPIYDLRKYEPRLETVPAAKALANRGAVVEEFFFKDLTPLMKAELDLILQEWLDSRKMPPLRFLNRVEPWTLASDKKYFWIKIDGRIDGFLAAHPMWSRHGWYLVDLLRRSDSPPGVSELLILEAMRKLQQQGYLEVSLGISPMSNLQRAPAASDRGLYMILRWIYAHGNTFYRFKSLYEYKVKFGPSRIDSVYLLISSKHLGIVQLLGLFEAVLHGGILSTAFLSLGRIFNRFHFRHWVSEQVSPETVVRAMPKRMHEFAYRCKNTLFLTILNLIVFMMSTDNGGQLRVRLEESRGFSWDNVLDRGILPILVSPFLHHNAFHIDFNVIIGLLFCGALECLGGSHLMLICLFPALFLTNIITCLLFYWPLHIWGFEHWIRFSHAIDVGASLGIFGCLGGLFYIFRRGWVLILAMNISVVFSAFAARDVQILNHCVATLIGLGMARFFLGGD